MRFLYYVAEIVLTWLILTLLGGLMIWGWSGFDPLGQLFMIAYTVVALGASIKLVLIGHRSNSTGFYRPVRMLSLILPAIVAFRRESTLPGYGQRKSFAFNFRGSLDVSAYDVVDALSQTLHNRGIRHSNSGGLLVDDNGTTWWLEAELGVNRVVGWVVSDDRQCRDQIVVAIRDFLERDMRLQVA